MRLLICPLRLQLAVAAVGCVISAAVDTAYLDKFTASLRQSPFKYGLYPDTRVRPQHICTSATDRNTSSDPYLLVVGCGYSGTGFTANVLTKDLGIPCSHEHLDPQATATTCVVSWPNTVMAWPVGQPFCRQLRIFVQVRNPLAVVHSSDATNWAHVYSFSHDGKHTVRVEDWVPAEYRPRFRHLPHHIRTLLWWTSFTLIGEWQTSGPEYIIRLEDVTTGNLTAFRHVMRGVRGDAIANAFDWQRLSDSIVSAPKKNSHVAHAHKDNMATATWDDMLTQAQQLEHPSDKNLSHCAICAAQQLCVRLGYDPVDTCGSSRTCSLPGGTSIT